MTEFLSELSIICIYVTMGFYALAFIAFALDLARRGAKVSAAEAAHVPSAVARRNSDSSGGVTTTVITREDDERREHDSEVSALGRLSSRISERVENSVLRDDGTSLSLRWALGLTITGWVFHLAATVSRGIAAGRVPWANMWEFSMTGTLVMVGVFLLITLKWPLQYLGTFLMGLVLVLQGIALLRYYVPVVPLVPALQSYWLVIHILVAITGTAFFALGFILSGLQLLQYRRERQEGLSQSAGFRFLGTIPGSITLESLAYRINIVGFIAWTFTLIAGAIWAEKAWGRYWGWDTKEVWTFIVWVVYAGYIHARATRGWRGSRSAWLGIIGFAAVMFNFGIVNVFFHGLHSYSGL